MSSLGVLPACQQGDAHATPEQRPNKVPEASRVRVEVASLGESDAKLDIRLPGEIEGSRDARLASPLGGYIESIPVKAGQVVKKGQLLARVDSASHAARVEQAKVEQAAATRELERAKSMGAAIPRAEVDAAETRVAAANAALNASRVNLGYSVVTAPFAGTVANVDAEVGEVATPGAPLLRLVQLDPVLVSVSVPGRDVVALEEGMPAFVNTDSTGSILEGKVRHIQRAADPKTRSFIVEVLVPNADGQLLPGMIASVSLSSTKHTKRIVLAQDWLVTGVEQVGVFVEEKGTAKWRPLQLGPVVRNQVVVEAGLMPGEKVVTTGHRELADGDKLLIVRSGRCCKDGRVVYE